MSESQGRTFVAVTDFTVGIDDRDTQKFFAEDAQTGAPATEVTFQGHELLIDGKESDLDRGKVKVAIREGWLQKKDGEKIPHQAPSAGVALSAATPQQKDIVHDGTTELSNEEKVVHTVEQSDEFRDNSMSSDMGAKATTRSSNTSVMMGDDFRQTKSQDQTQTQNQTQQQQHISRHQGRGQIVSDQGSEGEKVQGITISTPTESNTDLSKMGREESVRAKVQTMEKNAASNRTGQGMAPAQSKAKRVTEGISFESHNVGDRSAVGKAAGDGEPSGNPFADDAQVVGNISDTDQNRRQREQQGRQHPPQQEAQPVLASDTGASEDKYTTLQTVHPELPDWDFDQNWRAKLARLDEYVEDPLVIRSVYASESDEMKMRIESKFGDIIT